MNRLTLSFCICSLLVLLAACARAPFAETPTETSVTTETAHEDLRTLGISGNVQMYTSLRDPWLEPFSPASIWNLPLGKNANYVIQGYGPTGVLPVEDSVTADEELHFKGSSSDPERPLYRPGSWTNRCSLNQLQNENANVRPFVRIPDDLIIPDATLEPYSTPNNVTTSLQPDGVTLFQIEPSARCVVAGPLYGYYNSQNPYQNIFGLGLYGTHFGSGLSGFGGSLRYGELTGTQPIRHALKLNVYGRKYLAFNDDGTRGFRWPADRSDAYAAGPDGYCSLDPCKSNPLSGLEMGALLAIPPGVTPESLGLKTAPAKKMFYALQTYGTYIVDDSFYTTHAWSVVDSALGEFRETYGFEFAQGKSATDAAKDWYDDNMKLITALALIDDSTPATPGGAGGANRRAPFASPFFKPMDRKAPSIPSGLVVSRAGVADLDLAWKASSDNARVMGYEVLLNREVVARTWGKTNVTVGGLQPSTSYSLSVRALDTGLNRSGVSAATSATTLPGYAANFNDNLLPEGWLVSSNAKVKVAGKALQLQSCPPPDYSCSPDGQTSAFYSKFTQGSYTLALSIQSSFTGADSNITRVFFNRRNENNTYYLQTLQASSGLKLFKLVGGLRTELGSASLGASINNTLSLFIRYDASTGTITVDGTQNGATKRLFAVTDTSHSAGQFGVATDYSNSLADDVVFSGTLVDPPTSGTGAFSSNFDSGTAPGWDLANVTFEFGRMKVGNYNNTGLALHPGLSGGSFTFTYDMVLYGGDGAAARTYFNYQDASNHYRVEITGGNTSPEARLIKRVAGADTFLAASIPFPNTNTTYTYAISYNSSPQTITVTATTGGSTVTLFNAVSDASFASGQVGFGEGYNTPNVDNVVLTAQ